MKPYYEEGGITIYHGNCREVLPDLPPADLVLTDPPYGVKMLRGDSKVKALIAGDDTIPDLRFLLDYPRLIIWGGNNFCDQLPRSTGWLVWFKHFPNVSRHSQAELAWTNVTRTVRHYQEAYHGFMRKADGWLHPTQKPPGLMRWCLSFAPKTETVLDPFAGSGTTLVAAKTLGMKAIGVEIEERYCEVIAKRLRQKMLFAAS
jgi:site-specific DNA-methyltransferase (adenine-specific)